MTKQEFLELYGKSVYQVRLEIATQMFCMDSALDTDWCLENADRFVVALLKEEVEHSHG